jgi:hypothetical protein
MCFAAEENMDHLFMECEKVTEIKIIYTWYNTETTHQSNRYRRGDISIMIMDQHEEVHWWILQLVICFINWEKLRCN